MLNNTELIAIMPPKAMLHDFLPLYLTRKARGAEGMKCADITIRIMYTINLTKLSIYTLFIQETFIIASILF